MLMQKYILYHVMIIATVVVWMPSDIYSMEQSQHSFNAIFQAIFASLNPLIDYQLFTLCGMVNKTYHCAVQENITNRRETLRKHFSQKKYSPEIIIEWHPIKIAYAYKKHTPIDTTTTITYVHSSGQAVIEKAATWKCDIHISSKSRLFFNENSAICCQASIQCRNPFGGMTKEDITCCLSFDGIAQEQGLAEIMALYYPDLMKKR
jgi:hypothetical protein